MPQLVALIAGGAHHYHTHPGSHGCRPRANGRAAIHVRISIRLGWSIKIGVAQRGTDDINAGRIGVLGSGQPVSLLYRVLGLHIFGNAQMVGSFGSGADIKIRLVSGHCRHTIGAVATAQIHAGTAIHEVTGTQQPLGLKKGLQGRNLVHAGETGIEYRNLHPLAPKARIVHGQDSDLLILSIRRTILRTGSLCAAGSYCGHWHQRRRRGHYRSKAAVERGRGAHCRQCLNTSQRNRIAGNHGGIEPTGGIKHLRPTVHVSYLGYISRVYGQVAREHSNALPSAPGHRPGR